MGGVTNLLASALSNVVLEKDFQSDIEKCSQRHLDLIHSLSKLEKNFSKERIISFIESSFQKCALLFQGIRLLKECPDKVQCQILALGEKLSAQIMLELLLARGVDVSFLNAEDYIKTKGSLLEGTPILEEIPQKLNKVKHKHCLLISGFIASSVDGTLSLLGRNGSDYSASLVAVGVEAESCEIWTDVDGIYTADPHQIKDANLISHMSYGEALELAFYGAKILHPKTTAALIEKNILLYIKNTFNPKHPGTKIEANPPVIANPVRAISSIKDIALMSVYGSGMKGIPGSAARVFEAVARCGVSVILISQASSEYSICFCIFEKDVPVTVQSLNDEFLLEIKENLIEKIEVIHQQAIICIVGDSIKTRYVISGKFFSSLGRFGINVAAIAQGSSEHLCRC